jgi:alpha-tubulin suppressor-like RCC1 family protein
MPPRTTSPRSSFALTAAAAPVLLSLLLAACGSSSNSGAPTTPSDGGTSQPGADAGDPDASHPTVALACATDVAMSEMYICAIANNGVLGCRGGGYKGQLGQTWSEPNYAGWQFSDDAFLPVDVPQPSAISASIDSACALTQTGEIFCWGDNSDGAVTGDSAGGSPLGPQKVAALGADNAQVSVGLGAGCSLKKDSSMWCWGPPKQVASQVKKLSRDCAVMMDGTAQCYRNGIYTLDTPFAGAADIASSGDTACVIKTDGTVWCWGHNGQQQAGGAGSSDVMTPTQIVSLGTDNASISMGTSNACAIKKDASVWCWGDDIGSTPKQVTVLGADIVQLAVGDHDACARKKDGSVLCATIAKTSSPRFVLPVTVVAACP